jgi:translation initiation factor IF-1
MYHRLVFRAELLVDMEVPGKPRLERVRLRKGEVVEAQIRCWVKESDTGPVEMADLFLSSGETIRGVRMAFFSFVD